MQVRSAKTLIFRQEGEAIVGYNFLTRDEFATSVEIFQDLQNLSSWQNVAHDEMAYLDATENGVLVASGSNTEFNEKHYLEKWKWGTAAALFHFSLMDRPYEDLEYNERVQTQKMETEPSPELVLPLNPSNVQISLPDPDKSDNVLGAMKRRRTFREAPRTTVTLQSLADILYSGLGITGFTENCAGRLPLKLVPSAGARNPFEAYIFVRDIDGLDPGTYHYSAVQHALERIGELPNKSFGSLLGGQDWANRKNCIIVLVAYFERTMWKYEDPNAYRAVMVEAGHIAQNTMLIATRDDLSLCPTMALAHSDITTALHIDDNITISPVYGLALGGRQTS